MYEIFDLVFIGIFSLLAAGTGGEFLQEYRDTKRVNKWLLFALIFDLGLMLEIII